MVYHSLPIKNGLIFHGYVSHNQRSIGPHRITVQGTRCSWPPRQGAGMAATNYEGFKYYKLGGFNHQRWGRMRITKQWFRWLRGFFQNCLFPSLHELMKWLSFFSASQQKRRSCRWFSTNCWPWYWEEPSGTVPKLNINGTMICTCCAGCWIYSFFSAYPSYVTVSSRMFANAEAMSDSFAYLQTIKTFWPAGT